MSHLRFESNVNYDLGKTQAAVVQEPVQFESNVTYN